MDAGQKVAIYRLETIKRARTVLEEIPGDAAKEAPGEV